MAFTEHDLQRQAEALATLKKAFIRLEEAESAAHKAFNALLKDLGPVDYAQAGSAIRKQIDEIESIGKRA